MPDDFVSAHSERHVSQLDDFMPDDEITELYRRARNKVRPFIVYGARIALSGEAAASGKYDPKREFGDV